MDASQYGIKEHEPWNMDTENRGLGRPRQIS